MLDGLLLDPRWMQRKLDGVGSPLALVADYRRYATDQGTAQNLTGQALALSAETLARDKRQLLSQLCGRLRAEAAVGLGGLLGQARSFIEPPTLLPLRPTFSGPDGPEVTRIEGKAGPIHALALLPDGRLAGGAHDGTVRCWNLRSGEEVARIEAHEYGVGAIAVLPDGRLVTESRRQMALWDMSGPTALSRVEAGDPCNVFAALSNGDLVTASDVPFGGQMKVWSVNGLQLVARPLGHRVEVKALAVLQNDNVAAAAHDGMVRVWDAKSGSELARLKGDSNGVRALAALPDGRLAYDGGYNVLVGASKLRLWDSSGGVDKQIGWVNGGEIDVLAALSHQRVGVRHG
jgi:WD domain, G-beta repeat